jgi:dephospho-CoA kinase
VILVGLTGGIGSGKSTVSSLLEDKGAVIIDADAIVREVQLPGSPVLAKLAEKFGAEVLASDGSLDRQAVANIVFTDPDALKALNAIVHPAVGLEMNCKAKLSLMFPLRFKLNDSPSSGVLTRLTLELVSGDRRRESNDSKLLTLLSITLVIWPR